MISALILSIYLNPRQAQAADLPLAKKPAPRTASGNPTITTPPAKTSTPAKTSKPATATSPAKPSGPKKAAKPKEEEDPKDFDGFWKKRVGKVVKGLSKKECIPKKPGANETEEQKAHYREYNQEKGDAELEKYLSCYNTPKYQKYLDEYRDNIEAAGEVFGVNPKLMKCLILQESQWDSETISCGCAVGLGQQIGENIDHMSKEVSTLSETSLKWSLYMAKTKAKGKKECSGKFSRTDEVTDQESDFYKTTMTHLERGCKDKKCQVFKQDDRRCAPASIGATAAYLGRIQKMLNGAVNCGKLEPYQVNDGMIAAALAYNAGEGTALKAFAAADDTSLMTVNLLTGAKVSSEKNMEMRRHYYAIFSCMQKGNINSPKSGEKTKRDCFGDTIQAGPNGTGGASR